MLAFAQQWRIAPDCAELPHPARCGAIKTRALVCARTRGVFTRCSFRSASTGAPS